MGFAAKLLLLAVLLEATFRLAIPACQTPLNAFDGKAKLTKFNVNKLRDGLYTFGSMAEIRGRWHVNNAGWINDCDYKVGTKPEVAVIGDSYIEAFHVDCDRNLGANLRRNLGASREVYSFGVSGANLSQYLHMSRHIRATFDPRVMVFNIVDGDVLGSLTDSGGKGGFLYYSHDDSGVKEVLVPRPDSGARELMRTVLRQSALLRYVIFNSGFLLKGVPPVKAAYAGMSETDLKVSQELIAYTFGKISEENPDCKIIIVLDAPRSDIYQAGVNKSAVGPPQVNKMIASLSKSYGFHVVDLTEPMKELYAKDAKKFDFENNYHWNEYGHRVAADEISKEITRSKMLLGHE